MKQHVIFLDVDGVLNSNASNWSLDADCFEYLKKLITWFDADIVLSSSWRHLEEDVNILNNELKKSIGITVADKTGVDTQNFHRGKEIVDYLKEHAEITDYIIVDDDICDIIRYVNHTHIIHTSNSVGLTLKDVEEFINRYDKKNKLSYVQINNGLIDLIHILCAARNDMIKGISFLDANKRLIMAVTQADNYIDSQDNGRLIVKSDIKYIRIWGYLEYNHNVTEDETATREIMKRIIEKWMIYKFRINPIIHDIESNAGKPETMFVDQEWVIGTHN